MPVFHSNSLRIFSLNIGFWVDSSFLSILSLAAFVIFLSLVFSMKFFVFFPFKDCWVSWIYSFMSFIKFEIFSHYFFRYFFHHTASPLLKECGVRPLDVVPPVWSSVPFFLLPVFVFTDVQCGPRLSIHLKFTYSLLCHLHSTIESIQFLNFAYCYISIQNLYFITLFIICSFAETFLYFQSFENVCLCRNVSIIVCQIILTLALASVDLSFPLRI